jgi:hypothetical protein
MKLNHLICCVISCLALTACSLSSPNSKSTEPALAADPQRIKSHLKFLSDDLLEGRDTGSRGHEIAALYIAGEFAKYGLTPAGDEGGYLQDINFRQSFLEQNSPKLSLSNAAGVQELSYPKHYISGASSVREQAILTGELVFVGYGIVAPLLQHDDYIDLNVKGKVVVVLSGKPKSFPSEEGAHFGSTSEKKRHAVENGAIG